MKLPTFRLLLWALLFLLGLAPVVSPAAAQGEGRIVVLEISGPVTPAMQNYFERGIARAEEEASAVLIVLDTPGGSVDVTLAIVQRFRGARVPVILYVAPNGAQAASAGSVLMAAAHANGMAPETVVGAATPISLDGTDIPETAQLKAIEDLKATMRSLTTRRGEDAVALAEAMIEEARAITASEALEVGFIDAVAVDAPDLLVQLDGLTVDVDGQPMTLALAGVETSDVAMSALETILHALANPTIVGFLLAIAIPAILIELQSPGGWVAGFIGVISLVAALYGLGQLPVNWFGLALVAVAFVLLLMEAVSPAFGGLGIVGGITLVAGMLVLFNANDAPAFARLSVGNAIAISLPSALFFLWVATLAMRTRRRQPRTGAEGLIGQVGRVRTPLAPRGTVLVHGELWRATLGDQGAAGEETLNADDEVVVEGIEGFTLKVRRR